MLLLGSSSEGDFKERRKLKNAYGHSDAIGVFHHSFPPKAFFHHQYVNVTKREEGYTKGPQGKNISI